jgi:hypothetical protein
MFDSDDLGLHVHYILQTSTLSGKLGKDSCRFTKSYVSKFEFLKFRALSFTMDAPMEGGCLRAMFGKYL